MNIVFHLRIDNVLTDATSVVFEDPTSSFGIRRADTLAIIEAAGTALTHTGVGEYEYTFVAPEAGVVYNYWITWVYNGITYRREENIGGESTLLNTVEPRPAPLLPLDVFREIIGYNPYHFWGLTADEVPVTSACNAIVSEHPYQSADSAGRESIRKALLTAEEKLRDSLGYSIAPEYIEEEIGVHSFFDPALGIPFSMGDASGRFPIVRTKYGKLRAIGVELLTLLSTASVTYSDQNGDTLNDTFEISTATDETDASKIAVYFSAADRLNNERPGQRWRIQPLKITITNGILTIRGSSWLLAKPSLYEGYTRVSPLDASQSNNFVSTLDIYKRTTNPDGDTLETSQIKLVWDSLPQSCVGDAAAVGYAQGRAGISNSTLGSVLIGPSLTNVSNSCCWSLYPDKVVIRYLEGALLNSDFSVNQRLAVLTARLALAELTQRICACDDSNREITRWQADRSLLGSQVQLFAISRGDLNNPFGTRLGQIHAWKEVQKLRLVRAVRK